MSRAELFLRDMRSLSKNPLYTTWKGEEEFACLIGNFLATNYENCLEEIRPQLFRTVSPKHLTAYLFNALVDDHILKVKLESMIRPPWALTWPRSDGIYWFYGWVEAVQSRPGHKPRLHLVSVHKISNGYSYVTDGGFLERGARGIWQPVDQPELPDYLKTWPNPKEEGK